MAELRNSPPKGVLAKDLAQALNVDKSSLNSVLYKMLEAKLVRINDSGSQHALAAGLPGPAPLAAAEPASSAGRRRGAPLWSAAAEDAAAGGTTGTAPLTRTAVATSAQAGRKRKRETAAAVTTHDVAPPPSGVLMVVVNAFCSFLRGLSNVMTQHSAERARQQSSLLQAQATADREQAALQKATAEALAKAVEVQAAAAAAAAAAPPPPPPPAPVRAKVDTSCYLRDITTRVCRFSKTGELWKAVMQTAMDRSNTIGAPSFRIQVNRVQRVWFPAAWKKYEAEVGQVEASLAQLPNKEADRVAQPLLNCLPPAMTDPDQLNVRVNECFLWHGTQHDSVEQIKNAGFNERLCDPRGLLGAGNYFAESSSKSDAYTRNDWNGNRTMILAQVCLGHPMRLDPGARTSSIHELPQVPDAAPGRRYDSLIGTPRNDKEYAIYNGARTFPQFVVTYKRCY